jgi:prevent-host-death family protein
MKRTTNVVQLKARLSEYLRLVKAGNEVVITERGVPVARVVPLADDERTSTRRTRLARSGLIKPGRGRLPKGLSEPPKGAPAGVLDALLADRESGDR